MIYIYQNINISINLFSSHISHLKMAKILGICAQKFKVFFFNNNLFMIDSNDEIQKYIEKKRELQSLLLTFLENSDSDDDFQQLNEFIGTDNYNVNQEEFNDLFQLLINISNNHCRNKNFFL